MAVHPFQGRSRQIAGGGFSSRSNFHCLTWIEHPARVIFFAVFTFVCLENPRALRFEDIAQDHRKFDMLYNILRLLQKTRSHDVEVVGFMR